MLLTRLLGAAENLPVEVHLNCWVALELREDVLHIVHYVGEVDEVVWLLLLVWPRATAAHIYSLASAVIGLVIPTVVVTHTLEVLHVAETRNALEASNNILKILPIHRHLLPI